MAAGPELRDFGSNLTQTNRNVGELRDLISDIDNKIDRVELAIDAVDAVENKADEFSNTISKLKLTLKLMDKTGPLKFIAKIGTKVLDAVQNVTDKVREKAEELAKKIDDSKLEEKLDAAQEKLESFDIKLAGSEQVLLKNIVSVNQLITALDKVDELDLNGDPGAPAAAGADALVAPPNTTISTINDTYDDIKEQTQILDNAIPSATFLPVLGVRIAFDGISSSLSFLRGPLNAVSKVLKPIEGVLDAVGLVFNATVGPVINYITKTLGIDRIINSAADKITSLLPNPGIFDNILEDFDTAFLEINPLGQLDDYLGISTWLDELTQKLLDPVGDPQTGPIGIGDSQNDQLIGTARDDLLDAGDGDDTLNGAAGDDILIAGPGHDLLDGGDGTDTVNFRGNFTEYSFSQTDNDGTIIFNHLYPTNPRITDGTEEVQNVELYTFADFSLTHSQLLNSVFTATPEQTELNGTDNQDFLFASTSSITINGLGGNDILIGSASNDTLNGGAGDDTFVYSGSDDHFIGDSGNDTWRFPIDNSSGNPTVDADIALNTIRISSNLSTLTSIENIVVEDNRQTFLFGDDTGNRMVAAGSRDLLDGRSGDDLLDGGPSQDILIGGPGNDILYGNEGNDTLVAGELTVPGITNFYDGGEGDFDALTYASDIRDIVQREYINDGMKQKARSQEASGPVQIFAETGLIERMSTDGNTVIATDTAVNIEQFIGSDFNDTLYGGPGTYIEIDGGKGNDTLYGQLAGRFVGGGLGDDTIYAGLGGANYEGGGGFDVLHLTETPDVRWLVRLDGSIGSSLKAFTALAGGELAEPGKSLQNQGGALASGNVGEFDVYYSGDQNDYFELRDRGLITVHAAGGEDFLMGKNGGSNSPSFELYGEAGDDEIVLQDTGLADGGEGNDNISVDAGSSHSVQVLGGLGDDIIQVRSGAVSIDGGVGYDVLSAATRNPLAGLDVDLIVGTLSSNGNDRFSGSVSNIEELIGSDEHTDILRGSDTGDRLIGAGGSDVIEGRGGEDALYGGAGSDTLTGGNSDDLIHGGSGNDTIDGGSGIDTASWAFATPSNNTTELEASSFGHLDVDLLSGNAQLALFNGGQETDTLNNIENILGGDGNDTIRGDNNANLLAGGAGNDQLDGRDGDDVLILEGDDTATGGQGDDRFVIGLGDVTIDGGEGFDSLDFGTLAGTIHVDSTTGTYTAVLETDQPVWKNGGGTETRNANGVQLSPQDVLEADTTFANSTTDLARTIPNDINFEIVFETETQTASGTFSSIEAFISGAAKLIGSAIDDNFSGDDGVNIFEGLQGNDVIDGGGDSDTTIFSNPIANYAITKNADKFNVTNTIGSDGQDTLTNIERLQFSDIGIAYDLDTSAGEVAKLLGAVFGRESVANKEFVGIGLDLKNIGTTYEDLAELAINITGKSTPEEIVTHLWSNVVGSPPSTQQAQPFVDMLNNGTTSAELVVLAADTDLNVTNINLVGLTDRGIEYI